MPLGMKCVHVTYKQREGQGDRNFFSLLSEAKQTPPACIYLFGAMRLSKKLLQMNGKTGFSFALLMFQIFYFIYNSKGNSLRVNYVWG